MTKKRLHLFLIAIAFSATAGCLMGSQKLKGQFPGDESPQDIQLAAESGPCEVNGRPPPGTICSIAMISPTVPISFTKLEFNNGKVKLGPAMDAGLGGVFLFGTATYEKNGIKVDPGFFVGASVNGGAAEKFASPGELTGKFSVSAFGGFSSIAMSVGYDFVERTKFFGLATHIDTFSLLGKYLLVHRGNSD